jgi:hypothetical protein
MIIQEIDVKVRFEQRRWGPSPQAPLIRLFNLNKRRIVMKELH